MYAVWPLHVAFYEAWKETHRVKKYCGNLTIRSKRIGHVTLRSFGFYLRSNKQDKQNMFEFSESSLLYGVGIRCAQPLCRNAIPFTWHFPGDTVQTKTNSAQSRKHTQLGSAALLLRMFHCRTLCEKYLVQPPTCLSEIWMETCP